MSSNRSPEINEQIRKLIMSAGATFVTVEFVKKDRTKRRMQCHLPAIKSRIIGSERGARAAATRAVNHPELMTVYSVDARAIRSINLSTVFRVAVRGTEVTFRDASEIIPTN